MFKEFKNSRKNPPTVVFMNSCLWDLTRWGADGATSYKENMTKLMCLFKDCLPATTIVIWSTALPVASRITGGLLIKQIEFLKYTLRFDVMEANLFARTLVTSHGYDVIDFHYYLRYQLHRRAADGVHYQPIPVRYMTNLMLTHLALSWGRDLPGRVPNLNLSPIDDANSLVDTVENRYVPPVIPLSKAEKTEHIQSHNKRKKRKRRRRRNSSGSKERNSNNKKAGPERTSKRSNSNRYRPY
uniref:Uncharacterized protein n=2 Tax=Clastoptera arizonana TaxID=38151 RepID=A0A1B6DLP4_9HEMI